MSEKMNKYDYATSQLKCFNERIEKAEKMLQEFSNMTETQRSSFKLKKMGFEDDTDEEVIEYYSGVIKEIKNSIKLFLIVQNKHKVADLDAINLYPNVKKIEEDLMKKATDIFSC
tara:strand:- start:470 stop:814 length:345 start_codon:yes stop_codon:yes gene_type:complete